MPSTVRVRTPKKELDPPHFEQEELDREEFFYLQSEFGADGEYVELLPRPCCLKTASFPVVHACRTYHPTTSGGSRTFQMVGLERMSTLFATDFPTPLTFFLLFLSPLPSCTSYCPSTSPRLSSKIPCALSPRRWSLRTTTSPPQNACFYKTKSGCRFGKKCSFAHRQVDEQPSKRSKKNGD